MDWIRMHLAIVYGLGIGLLILAGAALVSTRVPTGETSGAVTWGTEGGAGRFVPSDSFRGSLLNAPALPEQFTIKDLYHTLESAPERFYVSLANTGSRKNGGSVTQADESGVDALLAALTPKSEDGSGSPLDLSSAYQYIPTQIASTVPSLSKERTPAQEKLHTYGLEAGQPIESYATLWGGAQTQVFKTLFEDRSNEEKKAAAKEVARALFDVGTALEGVYGVPAIIKEQHDALAASYKAVGRALVPLINAKTDDDLLTQLNTYNTLVDQFARNYLAVVAVFSSQGVTFDSSEPGRVFVFNQSLGLPTEGGF